MRSMTGFSRLAQLTEWGNLTWEVRSINHRYLEISLRLPETFRSLENILREKVRLHLIRGKVDATLHFIPNENIGNELTLNQHLIKQLIQASNKVFEFAGTQGTIDPLKILNWPGVVITDDAEFKLLHEKMIELFDQALRQLNEVRAAEGKALKEFLNSHLQQLEKHTNHLVNSSPALIQHYRQKLLERLQELNVQYDPNRLEQELVFIAQKMDIKEELERLSTHIQAVSKQLKQSGGLGRHLDFLMQELHRETNTLGVKCNDAALNQLTVEMKVLIEQMREQIQNIE